MEQNCNTCYHGYNEDVSNYNGCSLALYPPVLQCIDLTRLGTECPLWRKKIRPIKPMRKAWLLARPTVEDIVHKAVLRGAGVGALLMLIGCSILFYNMYYLWRH